MEFQDTISQILSSIFGEKADDIKKESYLIRYLIIKTRAANRDSKSRSSFANLYALYVLAKDFVTKEFEENIKAYSKYEGAKFSELLTTIRSMPFGEKLQNHALNNRLNDEFRKYFPDVDEIPIIRDLKTKRYWINVDLLIPKIKGKKYSLCNSIIQIIDSYVSARQETFNLFRKYCDDLRSNLDSQKGINETIEFIYRQLEPNVDARIFEIVTFSILKPFFAKEKIYWGWSIDDLNEEYLKLYKTGRTNANDGGIDFVMKPLGRFFQVTETLDFKKYFLDIDKIQKFPITFVIKTNLNENEILKKIKKDANSLYKIKSVVDEYLESFEEIINIQKLKSILESLISEQKIEEILKEIEIQSQVEFNLA